MNPQNCYTQVSMFQGLRLYALQGHSHLEGIRQTITILKIRSELNYFEIKFPFASRYVDCRLLSDFSTNIF
jgi:hypothetical protein